MEYLDINKINNLPDVPVEEIEIPEWKVKVKIKGLSKKMQVELARISGAETTDAFDYQKALLQASVIEPKLDDKAIESLYEKDASVLDNLFVQIANLNGIGGEAQEEILNEFQE